MVRASSAAGMLPASSVSRNGYSENWRMEGSCPTFSGLLHLRCFLTALICAVGLSNRKSETTLDFLWPHKRASGRMAKKRMGRPPKPKSERCSRTVRLRMSSPEYRKLAEKAKRAGLSVSEFLRQQAKD